MEGLSGVKVVAAATHHTHTLVANVDGVVWAFGVHSTLGLGDPDYEDEFIAPDLIPTLRVRARKFQTCCRSYDEAFCAAWATAARWSRRVPHRVYPLLPSTAELTQGDEFCDWWVARLLLHSCALPSAPGRVILLLAWRREAAALAVGGPAVGGREERRLFKSMGGGGRLQHPRVREGWRGGAAIAA